MAYPESRPAGEEEVIDRRAPESVQRATFTLGRLAILGFGIYGVVSLLTLARVPIVWVDEPWYAQPAWSLATSGSFGNPMFPDLHGMAESNVAFGRIYLGGVGLILKLLGLGVFQARLLSLVAGLATIYLTFLLGRQLWDARAGAFSAIVLAISPIFVMQTHDARPEILLLAFLLASLNLAVRSDSGIGVRGVIVAGVLAGLAADVHLNGVLVPFVVFAALAARAGSTSTALLRGVALMAGCLIGWGWWMAIHILPDPALFFDQWSNVWSEQLPFQVLAIDPRMVLMAEPLRFLQASLFWWPLAWLTPLAAILSAVILLRHHRDRNVVAIVGGIAATIVFMALFVAHKAPTYAVLVWPLCALLVGRWLTMSPGRRLSAGMLTTAVLASVLALAVVAASAWNGDYGAFIGRLRQVLPEGATVQAPPTYWFGLADHPYVAVEDFAYAGPYAQAVRRLNVDYIIADEYFLETVLKVERIVSEEEVSDFLVKHADLVGEFNDPQYGGPGWELGGWMGSAHTTLVYRARVGQ